MANEDFERTGRDAPIDHETSEGEDHRDLAVLALRTLARKHDDEARELARELRVLDHDLGIEEDEQIRE